MLKPQDIVILLKIISGAIEENDPHKSTPQSQLAVELCISASEVHEGVKRLVLSGLLAPYFGKDPLSQKRPVLLPIKKACEECLIYGVKYFFPVELGSYTRGIATSYSAPVFKKLISVGRDPVPVWPHAEGKQQGLALEPLYRSVPSSVIKYPDPIFYELLTLVDAIRSGRARERKIAAELLKERLK